MLVEEGGKPRTMTIYFVSRHSGAIEWAKRRGIRGRRLDNLTPGRIKKGVHVIGIIPIHLAAEITEVGGTYAHIEMDVPASMRGKELSADEMEACNARLVEYCVKAIRRKGE